MTITLPRPSPMSAWLAIFGLFPLYIAVAVLIGIAIVGGDSTPPVTVHETRPGQVTATTVGIEFRATRHRNCQLSALSEWERSDGVRLSRANPNKATLRAGQTRWVELGIRIPPDMHGGRYRVRSVGEYLCPDGQVFIIPTGWVEVVLP